MIGFDDIDYDARSDVGVRRSHNQDAYQVHVAREPDRWREQGHIFLVADGMGGHAVGEKAAHKAAGDIPHLICKYAHEGAAEALRKAYAETNAGIHNVGQENPEFRGLGTTATTLWLRPEGAWLAHVGDSRAYRLRGGQIEQLTFDHSAVWELARRQGIRPEQLPGIRSNVILRSLGPEPVVEVDVEGPHPLELGDIFLLCSDGLSGQLSDYEIGTVIGVLPPAEACEFLVQLANLRGGPDNTTVVVVRIGGDPRPPVPAPARQNVRQVAERHWPVWSMIAGIILAALALGLSAARGTNAGSIDAPAIFGIATVFVAAGLIGLFFQSRRSSPEESDPPILRVYSGTRCDLDDAILDKLQHAEHEVWERLSDADREESATEVKSSNAESETSRATGDLIGAFRARCRSMHAVIRRFNRGRHKEEVFQPVWDKFG